MDLLKELGWKDIVLIVGDNADAKDRKQELFRTVGSQGICVASVIEVSQSVVTFDAVIAQLLHTETRGRLDRLHRSHLNLLTSSKFCRKPLTKHTRNSYHFGIPITR